MSLKRRYVLGLLLTVLLALALSLAGCIGGSGYAGAPGNLDTVTVTGYGEAYGEPDLATVQFGYTIGDESVATALNSANRSIERITDALVQIGLDENDIQTTNFSVWPEDQYDPVTGMFTGERLYRVENTLRVIIRDVERVSLVIQTALDNGANNVYGLTFGMDHSEEIAAEARSAAVADARARAEQLATELGAQLGEARIASEAFGSSVFPAAEVAFGMGGGGAPPISEGQLAVQVQVNVTFDLIR